MNPRKITDHGVAVATLNKLKEEVT
jgi:hypothetical protein